jgi:hypothetical protein
LSQSPSLKIAELENKINLTFFILFISGFAQDLPPVNYSPTTYGAGNQNWMIAQDKNQILYFANNEGFEFNGSTGAYILTKRNYCSFC